MNTNEVIIYSSLIFHVSERMENIYYTTFKVLFVLKYMEISST
jgi:hypothetical protein